MGPEAEKTAPNGHLSADDGCLIGPTPDPTDEPSRPSIEVDVATPNRLPAVPADPVTAVGQSAPSP